MLTLVHLAGSTLALHIKMYFVQRYKNCIQYLWLQFTWIWIKRKTNKKYQTVATKILESSHMEHNVIIVVLRGRRGRDLPGFTWCRGHEFGLVSPCDPSWSYGSWIYNYLCNQCLSPPMLWIRIPFWRGVLDTTLCDKVCQWLVAGRWFSPCTPVRFPPPIKLTATI